DSPGRGEPAGERGCDRNEPAAEELEAGADAMGGSGSVWGLDDQRREWDSVREAGGVRGPAARGCDGGGTGRDSTGPARSNARPGRSIVRRSEPAAVLVGNLEREE